MSPQQPILSVKNLSVHFTLKEKTSFFSSEFSVLKAVDNVSFDLYPGETLGIVGESGCGKSTLARAIIRMIPANSGEVLWMGSDLMKFSKAEMLKTREDIQMIFQDPLASLNPRMTAGKIIAEPLITHFPKMPKAEVRMKVREMLVKVGMEVAHINRYPHEFSGGQCQRIGIARALITEPKLIVCDEPVSALDVSVQAQIINLLKQLQKELGLSLLFIAHDLSVVKHISARVMVLYFGTIAEIGDANEVINNPQHEYTKTLIASVPIPDPEVEVERRKVRRKMRDAEATIM